MVRTGDSEDYQRVLRPVVAMAKDFPDGYLVEPHRHPRGQLLYAAAGLMRVATDTAGWVVPPLRAVWIPAGVVHQVIMKGQVRMRTLYVAPRAARALPKGCVVLEVSPLLRELILSAAEEPLYYERRGRGGMIMGLILHELPLASQIALRIPLPSDPRLARLCQALLDKPGRGESLEIWAQRAGASSRTLARLFRHDLGMGFVAWRQQVRLMEALGLFASGRTVKEVAHALGYQSPSAFTAMFRQNLGKTPEAYMNPP